jgi:hypothetical protein
MTEKTVRHTASLLGIAILVAIVTHWNSMASILPGLIYLMAANLMCIASIFAALNKQCVGYVRPYSLLLMAFQLSIIGALNISSLIWSRSLIHLITDYLLVLGFFVTAYRLLSIADSSKQAGGYIPFSFIGFPRTRRFLFVVFAGYCTLCPLTLASLEFSIGTDGWRPAIFQSSQMCLLMTAIMSLLYGGLICQRYWIVLRSDRHTSRRIIIVTLLFLSTAGVIQTILSYSIYVYVLSILATVGTAIALSSLWSARSEYKPEGLTQGETIPSSAQ